MPAPYDPLRCIPSADAIRRKLTETERLVCRLRILLTTAEAIEQTEPASPVDVSRSPRPAGSGGDR